MQKLTVNNASKLEVGQAQYSAMCRPNGGIVDDLLVYRLGDEHYMLVVNGANLDKDLAWVQENAAGFDGVTVEDHSDQIHLLAVQGPKSVETLQKLTSVNLEDVAFYTFRQDTLADVPMIISRTGYTGELGFELYFRGDEAVARSVVDALWKAGADAGITWIGLGARDSLRLEKGYCLYGNDITEETNPIEAGLGWITKTKKGEFNWSGVDPRGQGSRSYPTSRWFQDADREAHPPSGIRHRGRRYHDRLGHERLPLTGLGTGIGMGYVTIEHKEPGTAIQIAARGTTFDAEVVKIPFV